MDVGEGRLAGKVAVVTGAGRGIGRALAHFLASEGAQVVVNDLDVTASREVAEEVGGVAAPGDAASEAGVSDLIAQARQLGEIDIYVANAGVENGAAADDEDWSLAWEVNVMAHVRAFRALRDPWLSRGEGRFIAVVSAAGLLTMLGSPAYSATKHAALGYAEWLSATYGDRGIVVQAVCPQGVETELLPRGAAGQIILGPSVISPEAVANALRVAWDRAPFLVLPHPEVADFYVARATNTDRWLSGMRRLQAQIDVAEE